MRGLLPNIRPLFIGCLLGTALGGCDAGSRDDQPLDLPAVHITGVLAGTSLDKHDNLVFNSIFPPTKKGATPEVISTTSFKIQVDRLLLPGSGIRQSFCLQPKDAGPGCTQGVVLRPSYDPIRREVILRQAPGNAGSPLSPSYRYELTVYSAIHDTDPGLRSFDGIPLAETLHLDFAVHDPSGKTPKYDPPLSGDRYCTSPCGTTPCAARSVSQLFGGDGCSFGGCHGVEKIPDAGPLVQPAEGLELAQPQDLVATAIGHVAHETETGENARFGDPTGTGLRFGRAMPILDATGDPANSYLVYKLLAFPGLPLAVAFPPDPNDSTAIAPEIVRLQNELVVGMPMPPIAGPPGVQLLPGEAEWVGDWILQGMPMPATRCMP